MNGLSDLNETYREYPLAASDDLIRLSRSKVKVTAGHQGGEGISVDAWASKSIFRSMYAFTHHASNIGLTQLSTRTFMDVIFALWERNSIK